MEKQKPFRFEPWMVIPALAVLVCLIFNFDPAGEGLAKVFGKGAERWAINIFLLALIVFPVASRK